MHVRIRRSCHSTDIVKYRNDKLRYSDSIQHSQLLCELRYYIGILRDQWGYKLSTRVALEGLLQAWNMYFNVILDISCYSCSANDRDGVTVKVIVNVMNNCDVIVRSHHYSSY